jgi:Zn-dependent protease with chaperone function
MAGKASIKKLTGIHPSAWEHPADRAALAALKQVKGLDEFIGMILSATTDRSLYLMQLASAVKVSGKQFPGVKAMLDEVVDTFDWPYTPDLFITQSPHLNAQVLGVKNPIIVLNSSLVRSFQGDELKAIIAHEMAHIMSGHALYKTLTYILAQLSLSVLPMAQLLIQPIVAALREWDRKSELSADRAELLAVQSEEPSYNVLMRVTSGDDLSQVNLNEFFAQAEEYESKKSLGDSIHKILNQLWIGHPFPVIRLKELKSWACSGAYEKILAGEYPRRESREEKPMDDIKAGYEYYKETVDTSDDPVMRFLSGVGKGIETATANLGSIFGDLFGSPKKPDAEPEARDVTPSKEGDSR